MITARRNTFWSVFTLLFIFILMVSYQNCGKKTSDVMESVSPPPPPPPPSPNPSPDPLCEGNEEECISALPFEKFLPLFLPPGAVENTETFARIINHSDNSGTVFITVFNDSGDRLGVRSVSIGANGTVSFTSDNLINGNTDWSWEALSDAGQGFLRLKLNSDVDILPGVYSRGAGGIPGLYEAETINRTLIENYHYGTPIRIFNPASNTENRSELRLVNFSDEHVNIKIMAVDATGTRPETDVTFVLPAGQSKLLTAQQLEDGHSSITGQLGDGEGKWRFTVFSSSFIHVMNLMRRQVDEDNEIIFTMDHEREDGDDLVKYFTKNSLPLFLPPGELGDTVTLARIVNFSNSSGTVSVTVFNDNGDELGARSLSLEANQEVLFSSSDLVNGNTDLGWEALSDASQGFLRLKLNPGSINISPEVYTRSGSRGLFNLRATRGTVNVTMENYHYLTSVRIFNPASNALNRSELRLVNPTDYSVHVKITGRDATGASPGTGVTFTLPAGESKLLTARQLEEGHSSITGQLGDGEGKWRLSVRSGFVIQVMNLMRKQIDEDNELIFTLK